jgi:ornithine decarboxylase
LSDPRRHRAGFGALKPTTLKLGSPQAFDRWLDRLATPCFVLDPDELCANAEDFGQVFPGAEVYYAVKANPEPAVLTTLAETIHGFEAASWPEIEVLLKLGIAPSRIIYGTAVKPSSHVERAVNFGIDRFAADSREELVMLAAVAPGCRVFIRTKVDDSQSVFQMSGKFGAQPEEVAELLCLASSLGLLPWGISFNVGSQARQENAWASGVALVAPVFARLLEKGVRLDVLNIGGGFPVPYVNQPEIRLQVIADHVRQALSALPYIPQLIVEPGRRLVATSLRLISSVVGRIQRPEGPWLYLDSGVYNALFEALSCQGSTCYPVRRIEGNQGDHRRFVLAGPTGDGLDVIARNVLLPSDTDVGHRLEFGSAGAYTIAMASSFNGFPVPPVHVGAGS